MNRREPLELSGRLEAPHLVLPLTRRLVGDLGSIVRVLISDVDHGRHHGAARGGVGAQLVGDQSSRDTALGFQQFPKESDGCSPIPVRLHEDVQDVTVLVYRAPQILVATRDLYVYHGDSVVDLDAAYPVSESTTLTIGGQNVFGNDPEANPIARATGNRYSAHTPFGINGGFYYVRVNYRWTSGS